ncbi:PilN domain-containing protein [Tepidibacter formicigenes]|jgi:type IV pilus assembly protein PilN|uniref:Type IV pilus assembly protein PilN n=1 Tax=Tepidibacter formicigenes DSM 15518 TaxID=1123349 RepID=A0A1M6MGZ1_9FIRM|nr:PilN domain-containing protein [Tepidibacter formicigenes]SHJ82734.1 type IV pilus assembly protein PilN [Tepidibacter formicigenes DSM 15518]
MKDFNFFSPYIDANKTSKRNNLIGILSFILFIMIISSFSIWTNMKIKNLEKEKASYEEYLNSEEVTKKIKEINEKNRKIEVMKKYYDSVMDINVKMVEADKINTILMGQIASSLPQDVFFKSVTIDGVSVQIKGVSKRRTSIAELEHELKDLDIFDSVHVSNISKKEQYDEELNDFTFTLKCTMKDGEM